MARDHRVSEQFRLPASRQVSGAPAAMSPRAAGTMKGLITRGFSVQIWSVPSVVTALPDMALPMHTFSGQGSRAQPDGLIPCYREYFAEVLIRYFKMAAQHCCASRDVQQSC